MTTASHSLATALWGALRSRLTPSSYTITGDATRSAQSNAMEDGHEALCRSRCVDEGVAGSVVGDGNARPWKSAISLENVGSRFLSLYQIILSQLVQDGRVVQVVVDVADDGFTDEIGRVLV